MAIIPGILANLSIIILIILIVTGWFSTIVNEFVSQKGLIIYLILTYILYYFNLRISPVWEVNLGGFIAPLIGYFLLLTKDINTKFQLLSRTILLGAIYFLIKELIRLDPIILVTEEIYQISALLVILIVIITTKVTNQIALLIGGVLLGDFLFNLRHKETFTHILLGNGEIRDIIWFSIWSIIILHYLSMKFRVVLKERKLVKILRR